MCWETERPGCEAGRKRENDVENKMFGLKRNEMMTTTMANERRWQPSPSPPQ